MTVHPGRTVTALAVLAGLIALAAAGLIGCSSRTVTGFDPAALLQSGGPPPVTAPVPNSPAGVLRRFEWTYNRRAIAPYRELFSDDFRFFFSPLDSAGNEYRGVPWTLEDELISATHLFVGGHPTLPPATSIRLSLDKRFFVYPDPNYTAWDSTGRWHKNIRTQFVMTVVIADGTVFDISGAVSFYMVRGDSALIPEELRLRGFGPDSARWYIRRWDDETAQPGGNSLHARAVGDARSSRSPRAMEGQPSQSLTWGGLKVRYR